MTTSDATAQHDATSRVIPLARPNISQTEIDAVTAVLRTPHLSLGPKVPGGFVVTTT